MYPGMESDITAWIDPQFWQRTRVTALVERQVPLRLICTYVGPSTDWLDAYEKRAMEHNRSPPPACNEVRCAALLEGILSTVQQCKCPAILTRRGEMVRVCVCVH